MLDLIQNRIGLGLSLLKADAVLQTADHLPTFVEASVMVGVDPVELGIVPQSIRCKRRPEHLSR